ncbi:MAG: DNA polymerase I, partial [Clostridia bacterium]|nr:DNA polymerase I [Clostridia bacterium]
MKLVLIDGNSLINRAFYAMPNLTDGKGRSTGGVYGFAAMLNRLISNVKPTHIAVAFDLKGPTFRHDQYKDYKALRKPMPEELVQQVPMLKDLLRAMRITYIEKEGYEADDILGSIAKSFALDTIIVSGDKDCLQLIDDKITVFYTKRGITDVVEYTPERLLEEGLTPSQVKDLKGLMGDNSDNIKGVAGVGEKTARQLIADYKDLDGIYANIGSIKGKLQEKLIDNKDTAYFSKWLATICCDMDINIKLEEMELKYPFSGDAQKMMTELNFHSLVTRFEFENYKPVLEHHCEICPVNDKEQLDNVLQQIRHKKLFVYSIDNTISFTCDVAKEYRVNIVRDLLSDGLDYSSVIEKLAPIFLDKTIKKVGYDIKSTFHALSTELDKQSFEAEDIMLMSYVLDAGNILNSPLEMLKFYGYSGEETTSQLLALYKKLEQKIEEQELRNVYYNIELPLVPVLYEMEKVGFKVDKKVLDELEGKFSHELAELTESIYQFAGHPFNINSPKQLAVVLFEELRLPTDKKQSTGADKLNFLIDKHPMIPLLLRYRQLSKLLSTYITGLKIDTDSRLRTLFKQAVTTTGRLSSTEPNLQNIPIRYEYGKLVRKAFVPTNDLFMS